MGSWPTFIFKACLPPAPAQPVLEAVSHSKKLRVQWQVPVCNPVVTQIGVRYREVGAAEWELWNNCARELVVKSAGGESLSAAEECVIEDLVMEKHYEVQVGARNCVGWGEWSSSSQVNLNSAPPAPAAPTLHLATSTSLRVQWQIPECDQVVTHVALKVRDAGAHDWRVWDHGAKKLVASGGSALPAAICDCVIEDLVPDKQYEAQVAARNGVGWGEWSPSSALVAPAAIPSFWAGTQMDQGWSLHLITEADTRAALEQMLAVTKPESLGTGRDARAYRRGYKDLQVLKAWRIENLTLWQRYCGQRSFVAQKIRHASKLLGAPLPFRVGAETRLAAASERLPGPLQKDVGEGHYLHGTRPESLMTMLDSGLNARVASLGGAFGVGVYLAEDVEKIDQYATADSQDGLEDLHAHLSPESSGYCYPKEDLFYCIVVRATLGASLVSRGMSLTPGKTHFDTDDESKQLFLDKDRRELVAIPGLVPAVHYHSLVVETGKAVKRFREFVVMDATNCYAEYLVSYRRV